MRERLLQNLTMIKIGGSIAREQGSILSQVSLLNGLPLAIVHGGGPEISEALKVSGIETKKIDGLRVTDKAALPVVVSTLDGINSRMVEALRALGVSAIGYGSNSGLLRAIIRDPRLGFVGKVSSVCTHPLWDHLGQGFVPVIAPIAFMEGRPDQHLNINGDSAAGAIAASLGVNLILATDVPGVLDAEGRIIPCLNDRQYLELRKAGTIDGGMIPKIEAGINVARRGGRAIICSGRDLLGVFADNSQGTEIKSTVRQANWKDIRQIYQLVNYFADQEMMLHRTFEEIERDIDDFLVYPGDKTRILGCAALHRLGPDLAEIRAVAVDGDYQKQGIGGALVRACLAEAEQMNLARVFLLTDKQHVFEKMGFQKVEMNVIPEKLDGECGNCKKTYPACGEIPMIYQPNEK